MKKVTLFSADIDTKGIVSQLADYKRSLEELKKAQKSLDTTTKAGAEAFVKNQAQIKSIKAESSKYEKALVQLNDSSGKFVNVQKGLDNALNKQISSIQGARDSNKELLAIRNNLNLNSKEGIAAQKRINEQLDKNNAFIKDNVSGYEKQKIGIGDYEGALRKVFPSLGGITTKLKDVQSGLKQAGIGFKRSGDASAEASSNISMVGDSMGASQRSTVEATTSTIGYNTAQATTSTVTDKSTTSTIGYATAQAGATTSTNLASKSLKLFRIALISTGIGAIVVALGSLIAFLSTTQAGIDQITKVTKPLTVIFSRLFGIVQNVGKSLFDAFSNPKQVLLDLVDFIKNNVINRFKAFAVIIEGFKNFDVEQITNGFAQAATGVEDVIGKVKKASLESAKFLKESIDLGKELRQIGIDIEKQEAGIASQRARANDAIKEQELIAKDSSKTSAERNAAAQEAARLQDEQITKEEDIIKLKIKELKLNQSLNDTSREELKELDELEAQLITKGGERRKSELKFLTATTAFKKEEAKKAVEAEKKRLDTIKRISDAEIEASKIKLELLQKENEANSALDNLAKEQILRDERIKILDSEVKAYEESEEFKNALDVERQVKYLEFNQQRISINEEFATSSQEIAVENGLKELESIRAKNQSILESGQRVTEELQKIENERIENVFEAEVSQLQLAFDNKLISEAEFQTQKSELIKAFKDDQTELELQYEAGEAERKANIFENELELRRLNGESIFQLKLEELERQRLAEISNANLTAEEIASINAVYNKKTDDVNEASEAAKVDNALATASALSGLLKELAAENKELAIAAAIIDAGLAVQKTLASVPFPANILASATIGIKAAKNVQNIRKAEKGISFQGTLQGASHAQGGINLGNGVEAEGGENMYTANGQTHIVNKKASSLINRLGIMGALSYINQREGGGVALNIPTSYASKGGLISTMKGGNVEIDYNKMAQAFEAGASRVTNTVSVSEINGVNNNIAQVDEFSTV